jgi:hypothetical protein
LKKNYTDLIFFLFHSLLITTLLFLQILIIYLPKPTSGTLCALLIMGIIFLAGIKLFAVNSYMLQFLVYFIYMNLQISFAFFTTTYFSTTTIANGMFLLEYSYVFSEDGCRNNVSTLVSCYMDMLCAVAGHLYVTGSGFIGEYLFRPFVEDTSVPSLCPTFILYIYSYCLLSFRQFYFFLCFRKLDYVDGVLPTHFFVPHNL